MKHLHNDLEFTRSNSGQIFSDTKFQEGTKRIQRHPWTPLAIAAIAWKHHFLCLFQLLGRAHAVQLLRPAPVCFVVRHQIWGDLVANEQLDEVLGQLNLLAVDHMGS